MLFGGATSMVYAYCNCTNPEKRGVVSEWWKTFKLTYGTHVRSAIPSKPCQKCTNRAKNVHLKLKRIIQ